MSAVRAELELSHAGTGAGPVTVRAVCDANTVITCVPAALARALGLRVFGEKTATVTEGRPHKVPYAGPVRVEFLNRVCVTGVLVFGDVVRLGRPDMLALDVAVDAQRDALVLPPDRPERASHPVRRAA